MSWLGQKIRSKRSGIVRAKIHSFWMTLDLGDAIQKQIYVGGFEPEQTRWISSSLTRGQRFVDVGANCGYFTALGSKLIGKEGTAFSFEPSPIVSAVVEKMINDNHITNVRLVKSAVGDSDGEIDIYLPNGGPIHSPSAFFSDPSFRSIRVPVIALDSYGPLNDGTPIDFIKIDVEGFEPNVIRGMQNLIKRGSVRNLLCEFNSGWLRRNMSSSVASLFTTISELGMRPYKKTNIAIGTEPDGKTPFEVQDIWFKWPKEG